MPKGFWKNGLKPTPPSRKGSKFTEEQKERMSAAKKNPSQETRMRMSIAQTGKKLSEETRKKLSENNARFWKGKNGNEHNMFGKKRPDKSACVGILHPRWIADRTKVVKSDKKHLDGNYKQWVKGVKNRDGWGCKISDDNCSGRLEAHHILRWRNFPELRYEVNNGITLCAFHHPKRLVDEERLSSYFRELIGVKVK